MTAEQLLAALTHDNVIAFLRVIREGESNQNEDAFKILYGGGHFESFDDHPRIRFPIVYQGKPNYTTAAGAFQIVERTWNEFTSKFGRMPYTPQNQTLCAVWRLDYRKALEDVIAGRLDTAIRKCTSEWTSLALAHRQKEAPSLFAAYGGKAAAPTPLVSIHAASSKEVKPMGPAVLIPILAELAKTFLPQLGSLFGSGSEVAQRNVAAATIVADTIVKATNSVNLMEAAEKIQTDPQALSDAKAAVAEVVYQLTEAGGGGIEGARKSSAALDQLPFWKQGAFYISLVLTVMPFMLLVDAFFVHPDSYDGNLRTQIVTGVMLIISIVGGFWLGSTFGSQKKDSLLAGK